jgi:carbamoyl-phosphate synthase large subunit
MNVIVTGVAGDIGYGIGRILREAKFVDRVIGCDIHAEHPGHHHFDDVLVIPNAASPDYLNTLKDLSNRYDVDAIIVTSEPELRVICTCTDNQIKEELSLVMANKLSMEIGFDKLQTIEFVSGLGWHTPWTYLVGERDPDSYPCVLKSRAGAGSQNVFIVKDSKDFLAYKQLFPSYICQEYIRGDEGEYTCCVYGSNNNEIRIISFRRRLSSGVTTYAELVRHENIERICVDVARALHLRGSINIQLRLRDGHPYIFEINPRFSSTVVARHKLGFSDVLWSLQEQNLLLNTNYSAIYLPGTKIYRELNKILIEAP